MELANNKNTLIVIMKELELLEQTNKEISDILGVKIFCYMSDNKKTQMEMSKLCGISRDLLIRLVKGGSSKNINQSTIKKITKIVG